MKWLVCTLLITLAGAFGLLALDPQEDAFCAAARLRDMLVDRNHGWQCVHYAAARGDLSALDAALDHGVATDQRTHRGQTPLLLAAEYGRLAAVKDLVARHAQLEARDARNGFTALHWAADRYHPAVARALIGAGARVNAENKWNQTPLWQAAWQKGQGNSEIAHILVAADAEFQRADARGNTPLMMAARAGHTPMMMYLLDLGADIDARNHAGRSALYQAVADNRPDSVQRLLARGANPNAKAAGVAPLQLALDQGHADIAAALRAHGATGYNRYAAAAAIHRGRQAYTDGDFEAAIRLFGRAIALQPQHSETYYRRGLALKAQGDTQQAASDLRRALAIDTANNDAREALARLYVEGGHYERALDALQALIQAQPDNARALYLLGEARHALGDTDKAGSYFGQACGLGFEPACSR